MGKERETTGKGKEDKMMQISVILGVSKHWLDGSVELYGVSNVSNLAYRDRWDLLLSL